MGWFIGGVLVGWLAEWLFFTFFMKKDANGASSNGSNATALQAELNSKSKEISILKAKLADASGTASSSATTSSGGTASKAEAAKSTKMPSTAKPKPTTASKSVTASTKTATTKTSAIKTSKAKATTATKTAAKKATAKKPVVKKAVATQPTTAKKPASKTTPKKPTPKAAVKTKSVTPKAKTKGDDFTRLSGIGPSMATTLNDLGIDTYQKLAAMDDDILRDMLESSGARLNNNKDVMDSWNEQATLADKGDFAGLKKLQDELKK